VIAFRCGSVPEVVEDGVSGFVVETVDQAAGVVARAANLDRADVRAAFETRFMVERMAHDYLRIYHRLIASEVRSTQFRKANSRRRREALYPKSILASGLLPSAAKRMGTKRSAKIIDSLTKPVVESNEFSVIPDVAAETSSNDGVEERETRSGLSTVPEPS
jgi:hypothetical protein